MNNQQRIQFENSGFLHLPGAMSPAVVQRVARAFAQATEGYHERWRHDIANGHAQEAFYDVPDILDQDDVFVDLVDLPSLVPILLAAVGADVQLNHTTARLFPPGKTFTAAWHSDLADVIGLDLAHSPNFFVKIHYFFEDLDPDQGCLAFIPGTHRLPAGTPRPRIEDGEHSPAVVKIVPKAGDCVLFNTHVMHMALDNTSQKVRKSLIYAFSHFWVKHYANGVPRDLERLATTSLRRQLFGVEQPGINYFDYREGRAHPQDVHSTFRSASKRLIQRLRGTPGFVGRP